MGNKQRALIHVQSGTVEQVSNLLKSADWEIDIEPSAERCEEIIKIVTYTLIVLGYDSGDDTLDPLCQSIRKTLNTPILLLIDAHHALDDFKEILSLGRVDFINLPMTEETFRQRLSCIKILDNQLQKADEQIAGLSNTLLNSMTEASFIGIATQFSVQTAFLSSYESVAELLVESLAKAELKTKVVTYSKTAGEQRFGSGEVSELELKLMLSARSVYLQDVNGHANRFQTLKQYLIGHTENSIIMAYPVPVDNEIKMGQIRDLLGQLLSLFSSRLIDLDHVNQLKQANQSNNKVMKKIEHTVLEVDELYSENSSSVLRSVSDLLEKFESSVHELLLTDEQEEHLSTLLNHALESLNQSYVSGALINNTLKTIIADMQKLECNLKVDQSDRLEG